MAKKTKKKSATTKIKSLMNPKKTLINLKVTSDQMKTIQENADKYAGGNYSAWIRYSAMNYKPTKSELANVE